MTEMIFAMGDDWCGVYVNGNLIDEGHSLDSRHTAAIAVEHKVTEVSSRECDLDWLHSEGSLPQNISDVKWS